MNGIDVILAELEDMDEEAKDEAADALISWLEENGYL